MQAIPFYKITPYIRKRLLKMILKKLIVLLILLADINGQAQTSPKMEHQNHPLICDPTEGICAAHPTAPILKKLYRKTAKN